MSRPLEAELGVRGRVSSFLKQEGTWELQNADSWTAIGDGAQKTGWALRRRAELG